MNKLLLLALIGFALVVISGAEEEKEKNIKEIEEVENREIREAGRKEKTTKKKRKSGKKLKNKSGKKSGGKSGRKSGKKSGKKAGKKSGRKSKKKSGKKSGRKQKPEIRASTCLNISCIDLATKYLKTMNKKMANFEKQYARISKLNKTGSSKSGKKGLFGPVIRRITENGGGNSTNLTCNGKSNAGAKQLTNLTVTLLNCEGEIKKACDPSNLPHPNITKVTKCRAACDTFKNKTGTCLKKTGSAACTCWSNSTLATSYNTIKGCDLSSDSNLFVKAMKNCTNAFSKCRKYEDDVGTALHACNLNSAGLVKKLKNLKQNSAALSSFKTKIDSAATRRSARDASTRALSCAAVTTTSTTIISMVRQNPVSYSIFTLIQTVLTVTFTCTATEKIALKSVSKSIDIAIAMIAAEVTHIQSTLVLLTGSAASDDDIKAASVCTTDDECEATITVDPSPSPSPSAPSPSAPSPAAPSPTAPSPSAPSTSAPSPSAPSPAGATPSAPSPAGATPSAPSPSAPSTAGATSALSPSAPSPAVATPSTPVPLPAGATPSAPSPSVPSPSGATPSGASPSPAGATPSASSPSASSAPGATPSAPLASASSAPGATPSASPGTPQMMTTGSSTRRIRRYVEHLMRKRMIHHQI